MIEELTGVIDDVEVPPTTDEPGASPDDVKPDTPDEKYVPYQRFQEVIHKSKSLEETLAREREEWQRKFTDLESRVTSSQPATDVNSQIKVMNDDQLQYNYQASMDFNDPNYDNLQPYKTQLFQEIRRRDREATVTELETKTLKQQSDYRAIQAYPDLNNHESELFKATRQVMAERLPALKRAGAKVELIPNFLEDSVQTAAMRLGIPAQTGYRKGQADEYDRQVAAGRAGADTGGKKPASKVDEVTDQQRMIGSQLKVDPKKIAARRKKLLESGMFRQEGT